MREKAIVFGVDSPLVGIVTEPDTGREKQAPVFLLLNAGIGHRVGPNRLYVSLARTLAERGLTSLRFDFSGIGDSPTSRSLADPKERAVAEATQAMDFLGRHLGAEVFIPLGLCSGADVGFALAARDERVAGGVLINATTIPSIHSEEQVAEAWKAAEAHHYAQRLTHASSWARVLTGRSNLRSVGRAALRFAVRALNASRSSAKSVDLGLLPELNRRGVELLVVFTEGDVGFELMKTHVGRLENLSSLRRVQLETLSETDHVLTPLWAQRRVQELVVEWTARRLTAGRKPDHQFASRTTRHHEVESA